MTWWPWWWAAELWGQGYGGSSHPVGGDGDIGDGDGDTLWP